MRSSVHPHGRGASSASRPADHATHSSTVARRVPGRRGHPSIASASAAAGRDRKHGPRDTRAPQPDHGSVIACSASKDERPTAYPTNLDGGTGSAAGFVAGTATAIGSLPHRDAHAAAALVLRCLPDMPAAPELPCRTPLEGVVAQWAGAVPGVVVHADGSLEITGAIDPLAPLGSRVHAPTRTPGLLTFLEVAAAQPRPPRWVKVQTVGPLTLGVALVDAGAHAELAFPLASRVARAWARALEELVALVASRHALVVCSSTSPRSCAGATPTGRSTARSRSTCSRPRSPRRTRSSACTCADAATCASRSTPVPTSCTSTSARSISTTRSRSSRFLDGDGWIAWGAIPTHRPGRRAAAAAVEGAARRVVRADAPRLRSRCGCARRRSSRPRAASPATARARPNARCCSPARSATASTTTPPRRSCRVGA